MAMAKMATQKMPNPRNHKTKLPRRLAPGKEPSSQKLSHVDAAGRARMVDVGPKPVTDREAVAEGFITLQASTLRAIADETVPKGEVLGVVGHDTTTGRVDSLTTTRQPSRARCASSDVACCLP